MHAGNCVLFQVEVIGGLLIAIQGKMNNVVESSFHLPLFQSIIPHSTKTI